MGAGEVVVEARNLTKIYRDFWGRKKVEALRSLSMTVERGEIFGSWGPTARGRPPPSSSS